jgi:hypothetical protein
MSGRGSRSVYREQIIEIKTDLKFVKQSKKVEVEQETVNLKASLQNIDADLSKIETINKSDSVLH